MDEVESLKEMKTAKSKSRIYWGRIKKLGPQKFIFKNISTKDSDEERILLEIRIWEKLETSEKPKAIPRFVGFIKDETKKAKLTDIDYYLIFEKFPYNLRNLIDLLKEKDENLPLDKLLYFARTLIEAMTFLQTNKISHRDFKPENLLLDSNFENIYVIDFSESKEVKSYTSTTMNSIVGTSKYLSPELKEIHDNGDEGTLSKFNFFKSDVFSFGLVCWN